MVVLAVPFSPRTRTPPTSGETVVRIRARARSSLPTIAENGNVLASTAISRTSTLPAGVHARVEKWSLGPMRLGRPARQTSWLPGWAGSQWRDRSGLAPDSSAFAAWNHRTRLWLRVEAVIEVVGMGAAGWASLDEQARDLVRRAELVVGSSRLT